MKATREQVLATETMAPFVIVSASAGTGKTRVLIDRILHALRRGLQLDEILAITFTRKAAEEIKSRLYRHLSSDPALSPMRLGIPQAYITTIDSFCARLLREHAVEAGVDPSFGILADPDDQVVLSEIMDEVFHLWYSGSPEGEAGPEWKGIPRKGSKEQREFFRLVELCRFRGGRELLRNELLRLLALARVRPDPWAFVTQLRRGFEAEQAPYTSAYEQVLVETMVLAARIARALAARAGEPKKKDKAKKDDKPSFAEIADLLEQFISWEGPIEQRAARLRRGLEALGVWKPGGNSPRMQSLRSGEGKGGGTKSKRLLAVLLSPMPQIGSPLSWLPPKEEDFHGQYAELRSSMLTLLSLLEQTLARYDLYKEERGLLDFADLELHTRRLLMGAGSSLRQRFKMVLVDEFQDINALQADIIRLLDPPMGRFLVGDVKQCIYQFRLSDPSVLRDLTQEAATADTGDTEDRSTAAPTLGSSEDGTERAGTGEADPAEGRKEERIHLKRKQGWFVPPEPRPVRLYLSRNFRSAEPILAFVNTLFGTLFSKRMIGGPYGPEALRPGLPEARRITEPVEVHLIQEPRGGPTVSRRLALTEAALVASLIRRMIEDGTRVRDPVTGKLRPVAYSDIAVVLRSPATVGEAFSRTLQAHGVPCMQIGEDLFETTEARDLFNLLRVLANAHDDIALAGLLRSPIGGFTDPELLTLRLQWPGSRFLLAALQATAEGHPVPWSGAPSDRDPEQSLTERCRRIVSDLERWRAMMAAIDPGEAATQIVSETGLLEMAAAAPDALRRVAALRRVLEVIRDFTSRNASELGALLEYLRAVRASLGAPDVAEATRAGAVNLISLHKSKGLEFPVVFASALGKQFNLIDERSTVQVGDEWLGLDLLDPVSFRKTPTVARMLLSWMRRRQILEEELRILYVTFTRARDKLIATGVTHQQPSRMFADLEAWKVVDPELLVYQARSALPWVMGPLVRAGLIEDPEALDEVERSSRGRLRLSIWESSEIPGIDTVRPEKEEAQAREAGHTASEDEVLKVLDRTSKPYPHAPATQWRGKYWVTEIKRLADADLVAEESSLGTWVPGERGARAPGWQGAPGDAVREGTWLHVVLQRLDPARFEKREVSEVLEDLVEEGIVPADWATDENLEPVYRFLGSPVARQMKAAAGTLEREARFTLKLTPEELGRIWPAAREAPQGEWFLVQGQIDALWREPDGTYVILDYKSDRVSAPAEIASRAEAYRPQMLLYKEAVERLWKAERVEMIIYFLRPGKEVLIE